VHSEAVKILKSHSNTPIGEGLQGVIEACDKAPKSSETTQFLKTAVDVARQPTDLAAFKKFEKNVAKLPSQSATWKHAMKAAGHILLGTILITLCFITLLPSLGLTVGVGLLGAISASFGIYEAIKAQKSSEDSSVRFFSAKQSGTPISVEGKKQRRP